ncbi:hypothetical protein CEE34_11510 [Candidatus Aerophobetes bacterium Ae_b3a]|nr:MAG: hypothetical protein CEE34_11510 [Candidatus Aerophobetes bacterium Ae_b3a]
MLHEMKKDDPDLYYYWGIALAHTGQIEKALEKWNIIGDMSNPRWEDCIFRARKILVGKRKYSRFEYRAD